MNENPNEATLAERIGFAVEAVDDLKAIDDIEAMREGLEDIRLILQILEREGEATQWSQ